MISALRKSKTLYVGNLTFQTTEEGLLHNIFDSFLVFLLVVIVTIIIIVITIIIITILFILFIYIILIFNHFKKKL